MIHAFRTIAVVLLFLAAAPACGAVIPATMPSYGVGRSHGYQ
jgi:hypothetical protein